MIGRRIFVCDFPTNKDKPLPMIHSSSNLTQKMQYSQKLRSGSLKFAQRNVSSLHQNGSYRTPLFTRVG